MNNLRPYFLIRLIFFGLLLGTVLTYFIIQAQKKIILENSIKIGTSIAENLARSSEYGVITADKKILSSLINRLENNDDLMYLQIVDTLSANQILASYTNRDTQPSYFTVAPAKTEIKILTEILKGESCDYLDIISPILTGDQKNTHDEINNPADSISLKNNSDEKTLGYIRLGLCLKTQHSELNKIKINVILIVFFSILIFTIYYYYHLTKIIVIPLKNFIDKTNEIQTGDLKFDMTVFSKQNEIKELGTAFEKTVSEWNRAETALKKSEEQLNLITSSAKDGITLLTVDGKILFWNPAAEKIFNVSSEKILGSNINSLIYINSQKHGDNEALLKSDLIKIVGKTSELTGKRKGDEFPLELTLSSANWETEELIVGIIRDITDRKLTERELKMLGSALKQTADMVVITNADGKIDYVNPSFEKITGFSLSEIISKKLNFLASPNQNPSIYDDIWNDISNGKVWRGRLSNRKKDGSIYEEEASISPLMDGSGKTINYIHVNQDISEKIKMEQTIMNSKKMEAIGRLAGGIAHDFNNILTSIQGFTKMAKNSLEKEGKERKETAYLQIVLDGVKRASHMIKLILTFGHNEVELRLISLPDAVMETTKLLEGTLPQTIKIETQIADDLIINANDSELHQVLMNICTNSCQAMEGKNGRLSISADIVSVKNQDKKPHVKLTGGQYVRLSIEDTGIGMPKEVLERIFDPFYTTKKHGQGSGIGLYTVHRIVERLNGAITVESDVGNGTRFNIYFPLPVRNDIKTIDREPEIRGGSEKILVVDDEEMIANMLKNQFESYGYAVTTEASSEKALGIFKKNPDSFDLVITDLAMPYMTGDELARELLSINSDIPIILCTGYATIGKKAAIQIGVTEFIMKPFVDDSILSVVRRVLDEKNSRAKPVH